MKYLVSSYVSFDSQDIPPIIEAGASIPFFNPNKPNDGETVTKIEEAKIIKWLLTSPARNFLFEERSEEHTSELQSHHDLVCRLLLEKKKKNMRYYNILLKK